MTSFRLAAFILITLFAASSWSFDERDPLLVEASLSQADWNPGQAGRLNLKLTLPPGYHGYEDQLKLTLLEPDGFHLGPLTISPLIKFFDKFSKRERSGFENTAGVSAGLEAPLRFHRDAKRLRLELVYQACSETYCLFPTTKNIDIPIRLVGAPAEAVPGKDKMESLLSVDSLSSLLSENLPLAFLLVFLGGILTSFTPCIFPMIPITLAIIGHESEKRSRAQNFLLSLLYVHGIATTYAVLGLIAASSGALFGASLGNPWILGVICALFLVMSLGMFGLFELQVPSVIRQKFGAKKTSPGYVGAYLSGLIAGVVASPCVGPVLVGLLAWVSTSGSNLLGFFLLFTYAMGLGLIFLVLGAFTELTRRLPRSGPWLQGTKFILACLMLGVFYYYLSFLIPARWHDGALGAGLLILGSLAGAFAPIKVPTAFARLRKGFAQAALVIGFGYLALAIFDLRSMMGPHTLQADFQAKPASAWQDYSEERLAESTRAGKPVIIDFWAEWCAACFELEKKTFTDPKVAERFKAFTLLRFDATKDSPTLRELKQRYNIQGLPTVLFIDSKGQWKSGLTLTKFENADKFLQRIDSISSP